MRISKAGKVIPKPDVTPMEDQEHEPSWPLPVTIIAGFLGSGKTTLLNYLLQGDHDLRLAVMVNDFGAINIDSELVVQQTESVISLANGCICCSVQNDLIGALDNVLIQSPMGMFDHIIVESSGVSDPSRIADVIRYPNFKDRLKLNIILSLVDASLLLDLDCETRHLAMLQLDAADIILLNKMDVTRKKDLNDFKEGWLNDKARVIEISHGSLDWTLVFGEGVETSFKSPNGNTGNIASNVFDTDQIVLESPVSIDDFKKYLAKLPATVLRAKGFLFTKEYPENPILVQLVGKRIEYKKLPCWSKSATPQTRLVLIGLKDKLDLASLKNKFASIGDH